MGNSGWFDGMVAGEGGGVQVPGGFGGENGRCRGQGEMVGMGGEEGFCLWP